MTASRILRGSLALVAVAACARGTTSSSIAPSPASAARSATGAQVVTAASVRSILSALADDSMQGRGTGTVGSERAARFIAGRMQDIGLVPAGDSGYFQRVPMALAQGRRGMSPTLLPSFDALDTIPAARRLHGVNVVGVLPGSDPALSNEVVLIDAHYDHLGIRTVGRDGKPLPAGSDTIYNGADDDGSGTTAVLEIARMMKAGAPPKRTIVFLTTTGEEVGLLGTRWYIEHPVRPLAQTVANMEIEMIGRPDSLAGGPGKAWLTGYERSTMGDMLAANGIPIVPDRRPDQHFFERSDNIAFARMGIPAHTLSSFNLHADYHQPSDDITKVDFDHMAGVINAAVRAVELLATGPKPEWHPGGRPEAPTRR
ncbi:MAG TPA: M20/M25/M40 family metallo-hydrolase [Gemmatimonadaceae bacterium]|nr:M20/M25/M40 family metallo-hydrolase [Gemmatimonadaceae bacterium]